MRNFSSMSAIVTALQSAVLARLFVTRKELNTMETKLLRKMEDMLSANSQFGAYRDALDSSSKPCIPWFGKCHDYHHIVVDLSPRRQTFTSASATLPSAWRPRWNTPTVAP